MKLHLIALAALLTACNDSTLNKAITETALNDEITNAEKEKRLGCLQRHVFVTNVKVNSKESKEIKLSFTNNLPWAISELRIEYWFRSKNRSVPWVEGRSNVQFPGGIEPMETYAGEYLDYKFHVLEDKKDLVYEIKVIDVVDADGRHFITKPRYTGTELTDKTCPDVAPQP